MNIQDSILQENLEIVCQHLYFDSDIDENLLHAALSVKNQHIVDLFQDFVSFEEASILSELLKNLEGEKFKMLWPKTHLSDQELILVLMNCVYYCQIKTDTWVDLMNRILGRLVTGNVRWHERNLSHFMNELTWKAVACNDRLKIIYLLLSIGMMPAAGDFIKVNGFNEQEALIYSCCNDLVFFYYHSNQGKDFKLTALCQNVIQKCIFKRSFKYPYHFYDAVKALHIPTFLQDSIRRVVFEPQEINLGFDCSSWCPWGKMRINIF